MRGRVESLSPRTLKIIAIGAVVLYAAMVWLLLVSPKRGEAAEARADVAAAEIRLSEARATSSRPGSGGAPVADVFRLAKAMPASADQSSFVLELSTLAQASGVTLRVIAPQEPLAELGGATLIPISVTVGGSYFKISKFVRSTQALVEVRNGKIEAKGRLFAVQSLELGESQTERFPMLDATIVLHAYVYDGPIAPVDAPDEPAEEVEPAGTSAAGSTS
ncbi:MAG: type 4a pilus biogenesis protein PilO [Actinobacteria bacterium]|nr:type 4a pilus biogenesis protein PilO [Actinomycetota bacterium]